MKSSNPSFSSKRSALIAAALALATSQVALQAQSSSNASSSSGSTYNNSTAGSGSSTSSASNYNDTPRSNGMAGSMDSTSDRNSSSASSSGSSSGKLSWGDRRFVTKAADDGQEEVTVAQLAAQKASNPDVRNFAQRLVQDHTQVNSELMSLASAKNVKLDQDNNESRIQRRLAKASGQDFDRDFVEHMIDEHEKDIKLFEKASKDAKDPEIRQFASKHVDHLRMHLAQAQQLQRSIVPTGRTSDDESSASSTNSSSWNSSSTPDRSSSNMGGTGNSPSATGRSSNASGSSGSDASSGSSAGASSSSTSSVR